MAKFKEILGIGVFHIKNGVTNFDSWSKLMIDDFGPNVRPYLKNIMEWSIVLAHTRENVSHSRINCWEFYKCGRQADDNYGREFEVCPACLETKFNGVHGGKNAGRVCWIVAGTKCGGRITRTFVPKFIACKFCDFKKTVMSEESNSFVVSDEFLKMLVL